MHIRIFDAQVNLENYNILLSDLKSVFICYDVSSPITLHEANKYFEKLINSEYSGHKYLVATKCDLEKICLEEGKELAAKMGAKNF